MNISIDEKKVFGGAAPRYSAVGRVPPV